MQITFDTNYLSDLDQRILWLLLDADGAAAPKAEKAAPAAAPAAKGAPKAKAAPKAEEPVEEPEEAVEEDQGETGTDDTMEAAVALATKLVSSGQAAKVKAALSEAGAKRVSELKDEDIPSFIAALS